MLKYLPILFLAGCAAQFTAPHGFTQQDANIDHANCKQLAMEWQKPPASTQPSTGGFYAGVNQQMPALTRNLQANQVYNNCMEAKGYTR